MPVLVYSLKLSFASANCLCTCESDAYNFVNNHSPAIGYVVSICTSNAIGRQRLNMLSIVSTTVSLSVSKEAVLK